MGKTAYIVAPVVPQNTEVIEVIKEMFAETGIKDRITITRKRHPDDIAASKPTEKGQFFGQEHYVLETDYDDYLNFVESGNFVVIDAKVYMDTDNDGSHFLKFKKVFY